MKNEQTQFDTAELKVISPKQYLDITTPEAERRTSIPSLTVSLETTHEKNNKSKNPCQKVRKSLSKSPKIHRQKVQKTLSKSP